MKRGIPFESMAIMLMLLAALVASESAGSTEADIVPEFYVTAMSNFYRTEDQSTWFDTYAATFELNWYPQRKPFYGGLVIDYRDSSSDMLQDNLNVGGYFRYNFSRWDSTTWLFVNRSPESEPVWVYLTRLRYRIADSHKIGMEALAPIERADAPKLMIGYYGQVTESLSMNVLGGRSIDGGPDIAAKIELMWRAF
jgi:hypothetical protein